MHGLPEIMQPAEMCAECRQAKLSRCSYKSKMSGKSYRKLEAVHSDVCRSFEVKTIGANHYFASFADEYAKKMWVYLITKKSEVFLVFKKFKVMVEK